MSIDIWAAHHCWLEHEGDKWLAEVLERAATCARRRIHSFFGAAHGKSAAATASLASVPSAPRFWQLFRRGTRRH